MEFYFFFFLFLSLIRWYVCFLISIKVKRYWHGQRIADHFKGWQKITYPEKRNLSILVKLYWTWTMLCQYIAHYQQTRVMARTQTSLDTPKGAPPLLRWQVRECVPAQFALSLSPSGAVLEKMKRILFESCKWYGFTCHSQQVFRPSPSRMLSYLLQSLSSRDATGHLGYHTGYKYHLASRGVTRHSEDFCWTSGAAMV